MLAVFAPLAWLAVRLAPHPSAGAPVLLWLWAAFGVGFMVSRAVLLLHRACGTAWMVTGA